MLLVEKYSTLDAGFSLVRVDPSTAHLGHKLRDEGKKPSFLYCKFPFNCVNFLLLRADIFDLRFMFWAVVWL